MSFEPGSTHIAHVTVKNEAKKPYTYDLTFTLDSDYAAIPPTVLKVVPIALNALEEKTVDVSITFWGFEVLTYLLISAYEEITETPLGFIYSEPVNLETISPPGAMVSISWD